MTNVAEKAYSAFRKRAGGKAWKELPEADRADWEAVATALSADRVPYAWEVTQGGRVFLLSAQEFAGKSYDCASFKPLYED